MGVLEAGLCSYVLLVYGDNALSGTHRFDEAEGDEAVFGNFGVTGAYAMMARRAMHTFGTGPETWKEIAVSQRRWAQLNPLAVMRKRSLTYEDYYKSKIIAEPFRLSDCCLISDCGRAVVITSVERARALKHPPAVILGLGQHHPVDYVEQADWMSGPTGAKIAGETAFKMAGITARDVDACQIYDCFTYTVEITLQDYGFFAPGEGRDWFKDGATAPGGRLPVNTSGGLLSEVYAMGMTQLCEGVMQIMGRCGERQLGPKTGTREPEIIVCSDNGGVLQSHSCAVLGRL